MSPENYMQEALKVAREGMEKGNVPIGAVLVLDDHIIARAHTDEVGEKRFLVHAEMLTLWMADQLQPFPGKRRDCVLYTTLEPCLMCLGATMSFFAGKIYYALESPADGAVQMVFDWQRDKAAMPSYRVPEIQGGLLREESKTLFREYVQQNSEGDVWEWAKTLLALP